jgi:hypothetical protein
VRGTEGFDESDLRQAYVEFANYKEFRWDLPWAAASALRRPFVSSRTELEQLRPHFRWLKLVSSGEVWWVEAFAARPVQIRKNVINDSDAADNFLRPLCVGRGAVVSTTDVYLFYRDKGDNQPDL